MPSILFVCTGNICRSPMAGALFQKMLRDAGIADQWQVATAGTWAREGYPAARHAEAIMREYGLNISDHRSRMVTKELLAAADLIVTMERGQKEALTVEFPAVADRVVLLTEAIRGPPGWDINDPIGHPRSVFRETAQELEELLASGWPDLEHLATKH